MIGPFEGKYRFLSNFYDGHLVVYRGTIYKTAEHAFQAAKAKDILEKQYVAIAPTPGEAKRRGRRVEMRSDWEIIKDRVMHDIIYDKFSQHKDLTFLLLATGDEELVEVNTWGDRYWEQDPAAKGRTSLVKY